LRIAFALFPRTFFPLAPSPFLSRLRLSSRAFAFPLAPSPFLSRLRLSSRAFAIQPLQSANGVLSELRPIHQRSARSIHPRQPPSSLPIAFRRASPSGACSPGTCFCALCPSSPMISDLRGHYSAKRRPTAFTKGPRATSGDWTVQPESPDASKRSGKMPHRAAFIGFARTTRLPVGCGTRLSVRDSRSRRARERLTHVTRTLPAKRPRLVMRRATPVARQVIAESVADVFTIRASNA
jgi:hypothetical protein